jgi:hypothetical protein
MKQQISFINAYPVTEHKQIIINQSYYPAKNLKDYLHLCKKLNPIILVDTETHVIEVRHDRGHAEFRPQEENKKIKVKRIKINSNEERKMINRFKQLQTTK